MTSDAIRQAVARAVRAELGRPGACVALKGCTCATNASDAAISAHLTALEAAGFVVVPRVRTDPLAEFAEMLPDPGVTALRDGEL